MIFYKKESFDEERCLHLFCSWHTLSAYLRPGIKMTFDEAMEWTNERIRGKEGRRKGGQMGGRNDGWRFLGSAFKIVLSWAEPQCSWVTCGRGLVCAVAILTRAAGRFLHCLRFCPHQAGYSCYSWALFWGPLEDLFLYLLSVFICFMCPQLSSYSSVSKSRETHLQEHPNCRNIAACLPVSVSLVKK